MTGSESKRVFFALWPPEEVRRQLSNCQSPSLLTSPESHFVAASNLHLTLHYIGNADTEYRQCIEQAAAQLHCRSFELVIDVPGFFKETRVVWVGPQHTGKALSELHDRLGTALADCGYKPETRSYSPHITLARKINRPPPATMIKPIIWSVREFVLLESISGPEGVQYTVLRHYPLHC